MPAEKLYMKASENRRSNKPIMEKRRRARINHCLNDLKTLILEALKKDPARHSKLEKADILEMTVKHLQNLQRQQMAMAVAADPTVLSKYRAGYNECANEVSRYVSRLENVEPAVKQRLLSHLTQHVKNLQSVGEPVASPMTLAGLATSYPLHLPGATGMLATGGDGGLFRGLQLIPTRLANGDIVFLLPGQTLSAGASPFNFPTSNLQSKDKPLSVEVSSEPPSSPAAISLSPELQMDSPTTAVAQDLSLKLSVSRYQENVSPSLPSPTHTPNSTPPLPGQDDPKATPNGKDPWRPW